MIIDTAKIPNINKDTPIARMIRQLGVITLEQNRDNTYEFSSEYLRINMSIVIVILYNRDGILIEFNYPSRYIDIMQCINEIIDADQVIESVLSDYELYSDTPIYNALKCYLFRCEYQYNSFISNWYIGYNTYQLFLKIYDKNNITNHLYLAFNDSDSRMPVKSVLEKIVNREYDEAEYGIIYTGFWRRGTKSARKL